MDFSLTMEQEILRNSVRQFAENEIKPVAKELDEKEEFSYETMQKMAELGLFGMFVSEDYGGQAMDYVSYIIATEEIARVDGSHAATVAAGNSLGIGPIYYYGNEEQKKKYLPKLCAGETLWGFGLTEPNAGSDAGNTRTTAVLDVAKPKERMLIVSYGSGAGSDALSFQATKALTKRQGLASQTRDYVARRSEIDYGAYVRFTGKLLT